MESPGLPRPIANGGNGGAGGAGKTANGSWKQVAFELKGTMAPLTVLRLHTVDLMQIERQLRRKIHQQPQMFLHAPVLLDLAILEEPGALALTALVSLMRSFKLVPVGVTNAPEAMTPAIAGAGIGVVQTTPVAKARGPVADVAEDVDFGDDALTPGPVVEARKPAPPPTNLSANLAALAPPAPTLPPMRAMPTSSTPTPLPSPAPSLVRAAHGGPMVINTPVRSGQVVYAKNNDLVVLAPVNPGAQVMADGHVHIYAPLRGRAVAGAQGLPGARLFCQRLEAELVAVGDAYVTSEEIPPQLRGRAVQVYLEAGECRIAAL